MSGVCGALLFVSGCSGGGGGGGGAPPIDPDQSSFTADVLFGTPADGVAEVEFTAAVMDVNGNPVPGALVQLDSSGYGNVLVQPGATDANGIAVGRLSTTVAEKKKVTALVNPGSAEVDLGLVTTEFVNLLANTYYVRESGSDADSGAAPLEAWRTLGYAVTQVGAGDTLYVGAGTYEGGLTVSVAGGQADPLEIRGDTDGCFTGDPGLVLVDAGGAGYGLRLENSAHVTLSGLSIRDGGGPSGAGIWVVGGSNASILDCHVFESARGMHVEGVSGLLLENLRLTANQGDGMFVSDSADVSLMNSLVYGNAGHGIFLDGASTGLDISFSTFFGNGADQLHESAAGNTGEVANNVFSEGGGDGLELAEGSGLAEHHNLYWAHAGESVLIPNGLPHPTSIESDPLFVGPFGGDGILGGLGFEDDDFRFGPGSLAFDASDRLASQTHLAHGGTLATLSSRTDGMRDGEEDDGPSANLGFHYAVALDEFSSLEPGSARVAFALPGNPVVMTRAWDRSTDLFDSELATQATNSEIEWVIHRVSPLEQPEEIVAVLVDNGAGTDLIVRAWDGRKWSVDSAAPVTSAISSANAEQRGFDLEFEALSGDALLVRSNDDANPIYRTRVGGVWSDDLPVFPTALGAGSVLWVELLPQAGTDSVAMVALDDQANLTASVWTGDEWSFPILLDTEVNEVRSHRAFDLAWEALSGDLMVSWGFSTFVEETRYAELTELEGGGSGWVSGLHNSTDSVGAIQVLASDPSSDRIAAGFGEGPLGDDVVVAVWNGQEWGDNAELTFYGANLTRAIDVGWIGDTGRAYALYREAALSGTFNLALWDVRGWKIQPPVALQGVGRIVRTQAHPIEGEDRTVFLLFEENGGLFAIDYDGTNWTVLNGGMPLAMGLDPMRATQPFSFDLRRL